MIFWWFDDCWDCLRGMFEDLVKFCVWLIKGLFEGVRVILEIIFDFKLFEVLLIEIVVFDFGRKSFMKKWIFIFLNFVCLK